MGCELRGAEAGGGGGEEEGAVLLERAAHSGERRPEGGERRPGRGRVEPGAEVAAGEAGRRELLLQRAALRLRQHRQRELHGAASEPGEGEGVMAEAAM